MIRYVRRKVKARSGRVNTELVLQESHRVRVHDGAGKYIESYVNWVDVPIVEEEDA